jgi:hypothetical protein
VWLDRAMFLVRHAAFKCTHGPTGTPGRGCDACSDLDLAREETGGAPIESLFLAPEARW